MPLLPGDRGGESDDREKEHGIPMKKISLTGIVLVLLGGWMITYQGLTYLSVDIFVPGTTPVHPSTPPAVFLAPLMGAITFAVGVVLLVVGIVRNM